MRRDVTKRRLIRIIEKSKPITKNVQKNQENTPLYITDNQQITSPPKINPKIVAK